MAASAGTTQRRLAAAIVGLTLALASAGMRSSSATVAAGSTVAVIVRGAPGTSMAALSDAVRDAGGRVDRELPLIEGIRATVPAVAVERLEAEPEVAVVSPDAKMVPLAYEPALGYDPVANTGSMSAVTRIIGAQEMWAAGFTGKGVDVALIDTGVTRVAGVDDPAKVIDGPDLSFDSQSPAFVYKDTFGHGTHMAGIIAGRDGPEMGDVTAEECPTCLNSHAYSDTTKFTGVAPDARIVNVKVGATDGAADVSQVIAAIDWVVKHRRDNGLDIRVISLSFGTNSKQDYTKDPLAYAAELAWRRGIVVVAAAGNDGTNVRQLSNPAYHPLLLAVGADDPKGTLAREDDAVPGFPTRSATKRTTDVIAPGVSVLSLRVPGSFIDENFPEGVTGSRFVRGTGTSQSTAIVAGLAALLLDAYPDATPDSLKSMLMSSTFGLAGFDKAAQGKGLVDGVKAAKQGDKGKAQDVVASAGAGSLEDARGDVHVFDGNKALTGEYDIFGKKFSSSSWAKAAAALTSWDGGLWNGSRWSGDGWTGSRWSSATWIDPNWSGTAWSGSRWSNMAWDGSRWSGDGWNGSRWTGSRWSGSRWSSVAWK